MRRPLILFTLGVWWVMSFFMALHIHCIFSHNSASHKKHLKKKHFFRVGKVRKIVGPLLGIIRHWNVSVQSLFDLSLTNNNSSSAQIVSKILKMEPILSINFGWCRWLTQNYSFKIKLWECFVSLKSTSFQN